MTSWLLQCIEEFKIAHWLLNCCNMNIGSLSDRKIHTFFETKHVILVIELVFSVFLSSTNKM